MALALGLSGHQPHLVDPASVREELASVWGQQKLRLGGSPHVVTFGRPNITWLPKETLPLHSNGMTFEAYDGGGRLLDTDSFYSVGGGFFVDAKVRVCVCV